MRRQRWLGRGIESRERHGEEHGPLGSPGRRGGPMVSLSRKRGRRDRGRPRGGASCRAIRGRGPAPSERQLAVEFGASRPMVREALRLARRARPDRRRSGSWRVRPGDTGPRSFQPLDLEYRRRGTTARQLSETRLMLETEAAALATAIATTPTWRPRGRARPPRGEPTPFDRSATTSPSTPPSSRPPTTRSSRRCSPRSTG
jgi:hypothetical protein